MNSNGRNDQWGFVGPGGGGAMFHPAINPLNPDHVFVSCDMTGSFVTYDGGKKWRMFNLRGVTRFYQFDQSNPNVAYAGTSNMLFKSENRGNTWSTIYPDPDDIVAIHAQGDHAQEVVITRDSIITEVKSLVVDPDEPRNLYLLIKRKKIDLWPRPSDQIRFYMVILASKNAGKDWVELDRLRFDLDKIFIDPNSPVEDRNFYVTGKDGMGARINGNWQNLPLPVPAGSVTQYVDGFDPHSKRHFIYALTGRSYFNPQARDEENGIYRTDDGGITWTRIDQSLPGLKGENGQHPYFRSIAVSYYNPGHLYLSYSQLRISAETLSFGVAKSNDYGNTWELTWEDRVISNNPDRGYQIAANRESGWLDHRFGPTWGENPFHMAVALDDPNVCYATDFGRTIKTIDGGKSWQQAYTRKQSDSGWQSNGLQVTTGYMLAFDPFDDNHIFLAETDVGLLESFDGGISWSSATNNNGVPNAWVNSTYWLIFDPKVKDRIWAAMSANHDLPRPKMWRHLNMDEYQGGVLTSQDGGRTWEPVSNDIGESAITHILLDQHSNPAARTLYACAFGKGVYKSTDGGYRWQIKNKGLENAQPAAWRIYQGKGDRLYLVVARKSEDGSIGNPLDGALYRSMDGAESWQKMALPEGVNGPTSLLVDAQDSSRIYLSAWGRYGKSEFSPDIGGGIFVTENEGKSWQPMMTGDQHIHDLTQDPGNGVLYACGFNSSAYRSENKGGSWKRIRGYNFKWGKRVQPDPFNQDQIYVITFGGGVWYGPAKGDENALEDIITPQTAYHQ